MLVQPHSFFGYNVVVILLLLLLFLTPVIKTYAFGMGSSGISGIPKKLIKLYQEVLEMKHISG